MNVDRSPPVQVDADAAQHSKMHAIKCFITSSDKVILEGAEIGYSGEAEFWGGHSEVEHKDSQLESNRNNSVFATAMETRGQTVRTPVSSRRWAERKMVNVPSVPEFLSEFLNAVL